MGESLASGARKYRGRFAFALILLMCVFAPSFHAAQTATQHGVALTWKPSASNTAVAQYIYRANAAAGPWTQIQMFNDNTTATWFDPTATGQPFYEIDAADAAGNQSGPSNIAQASVAVPGNPNPPSGLAAVSQ